MSESVVQWLTIGSLEDIPREGARTLDVDGQRLAVFRTAEDRVFALDDHCPHRGGPLSQGIVHGNCVTCPLHNLVVSLDTGNGGDEGTVNTHPVKLDGNRVLLGIPQDKAKRLQGSPEKSATSQPRCEETAA